MKLSTRRLLAYLIDMVIILIFILLINFIIGPNKYEEELKIVNEEYSLNQIKFTDYKDEYISLTHKIDKSEVLSNSLSTILIIIIFIVIPYKKNGQTIGSKVLKIKIKKEKLTILDLLVRGVVVNGLGYMLIAFIILFLVKDDIYFVLINFLAFCQISVVIINGFMVLYKEEHIGLTDILTNSRIEEIK